ncbi:site-specific tyrosine recombinase/integron integrase [Gilvibacter sp.]|uniref:site-specific tyrosine recombinase/integron integrase n=1 Tax=Gilvibacter sp. TaxID=2729997 RepID=UPI0025C6609C|nr:site-specific tyrosine recombinase/integron integrase [Gilvibacter sp.]NQX78619.1 site-specific integrase [Gilvibacter sp.]
MIVLTRRQHRGAGCIFLKFAQDPSSTKRIKQLKGLHYSVSLKSYYVLEADWTLDGLMTAFDQLDLDVGLKGILSDDSLRLLEQFKDYLLGQRLSPSTITTYSNFIIGFLKFLNDRPLAEVDNTVVRLFVEQQVKQRNYAISTHRQLISAIKHFGTLFLESEIDTSQLKRPFKSKYLPTVLSEEEVIDLLRFTRNLKHRVILALLYSSGLRIGELMNLKLQHIDLDRRQLYVKNSKGRKDRVVILAESFIPLLLNYLTSYSPKDYFIEGANGKAYAASSVRKFLKRSCQRAGIKKRVTPHTLRHSYATHLIEKGVGLRYVQELLGHAKPETTMIYTHVAKKDLLAIRSPLDTALERLSKQNKGPLIGPLSGNLGG